VYGKLAGGIGNRIAVRIDFRESQHFVHPGDEAIRHDMLEVLGLVVHFLPPEAHDPYEKQLDQPVPPQHERRQREPGRAEADPVVGLVVDQARLGQRLDHGRGRAGHDPEGRRQLAHGQPVVVWALCGAEVDGLEIVLDGAGRKHVALRRISDVLI